MEMTVTRALAELKLLDKRISDKTDDRVRFVALARGQEAVPGFESRDAFQRQAAAAIQSTQDLIKRRAAIKSAIVLSNATTQVTIAGRSMSVAEAIEYKTSIRYERALLERMSSQLASVTESAEKENVKVRAEADKRTDAALGEGSRDNKAHEYRSIFDAYMERNAFQVIAPKGLAETIAALRERIESFEYQVDFTLSEINSLTRISVPD